MHLLGSEMTKLSNGSMLSISSGATIGAVEASGRRFPLLPARAGGKLIKLVPQLRIESGKLRRAGLLQKARYFLTSAVSSLRERRTS